MSTSLPDGLVTELAKARREVAERDQLIAELGRSQSRIEHLGEISKLLLGFETVERTVPSVMTLLSTTLPLASAIFVETSGKPHTLAFHHAGASARSLDDAKAHLQNAYEYLVPSRLDVAWQEAGALELVSLRSSELHSNDRETPRFVLMPLVVGHGMIFGALQVEGTFALAELDLVFVNAVANQLASAVQRDSTERVLRASESKFAGIVAIAADAVISIDESQRIVLYNDGAEKIFGWSRAEALGQSLDMLLAKRFRNAHRGHLRDFGRGDALARKMGVRHPGIFGLRKNGEEFPADAAISKLRIEGSWLFTVMLRDITEQRRVEQEKMFLAEVGTVLAATLDSAETLANVARLVLRDFADFCLIDFLDEHGELRRLEVVAADPAKAEAAELLKHLPLDREQAHLSLSILKSGQSLLIERVSPETLRAMAQTEEHAQWLSIIAPTSLMGVPLFVGGKLVGALMVASCRLEKRYSAADLRVLRDVGQRASFALESARLYGIAQRAVRAREDVLGIVAHDLRNPLGSILLQTTLQQRTWSGMERRARRPNELIQRAALRMKRLIQDLLDMTSMEAGALSLQREGVSPSRVIAEAVEAQLALTSAGELQLRCGETAGLPIIWADRERLLQVFENLIGNAAKFTQPGGVITLEAGLGDGEIIFSVADTGVGISALHLPHLFDRFWQVKQTDRRGAGLGLAIVKGLVNSHGGRLWVESREGHGTTFFFSVPVVVS